MRARHGRIRGAGGALVRPALPCVRSACAQDRPRQGLECAWQEAERLRQGARQRGLWTTRHNAVLLAISYELSFINNVHKTDAYSVFEGKFGDGSEAASRLAEAFFAGDDRRRQWCVPDIYLEPHEVPGIRIVEKKTLYELKQINLRTEYFQVNAWKDPSHAVHLRAGQLHDEYCRKLHDVDRAAGTRCPHQTLPSSSCARSDNDRPHSVSSGEQHSLPRHVRPCARARVRALWRV